jgi:predicted DNA-binding protein
VKRLSITLPDELHEFLSHIAARQGRSVSNYVVRVLTEAWERCEREDAADKAPILQRSQIPAGEGNTVQVPKLERLPESTCTSALWRGQRGSTTSTVR